VGFCISAKNMRLFNRFQNNKIKPSTLLGFLISGFLLWLMFKQSKLELQQVFFVLKNRDSALYMLLAMLLFMLMMFFHSLRTRIVFVDDRTKIRDISAYPSLAIGSLYNNLLPGKIGEVMRAWHFSKVNKKPFSSTLAVFVTEKVIDAMICIPLFVIVFLIQPFIHHYIQYLFVLILGISILMIPIIYLFNNYKGFNRFLFGFFPTWIFKKNIFKVYVFFKFHASRMWKYKSILYFVFLGYAMFLVSILQYFLVLKAIGFDPPIFSFFSAYVLAVSMIIIAFIPSAPGNLGVAHYGIYASLLLLAEVNHISLSPVILQQFAISAICMHFTYFIPEILIGIIFLLKERNRIF
jgi:glycosyltransferase 2 family protein